MRGGRSMEHNENSNHTGRWRRCRGQRREQQRGPRRTPPRAIRPAREGWHPARLSSPDREADHRVRARRCRSAHRDRARRCCRQKAGVWPTVAPTGNAGRRLLARTFRAWVCKRRPRKPCAHRAPTGRVHAGAGAESEGVDHSGPRRKCGPAIIGRPISGPHFWPVRAQTGREQAAHWLRARRCVDWIAGCGPQWPPSQMRTCDYWLADFGPPFLAGARANRAREGRPQGECTQVRGPWLASIKMIHYIKSN